MPAPNRVKPESSLSRPGQVYKHVTVTDGTRVTLRVARPEDLDNLMSFINDLVKEKRRDESSPLYWGFDKRVTLKEEREWLTETIQAIKQGNTINVVAEIDGKIIANGEVKRGRYDDNQHHGQLGLTMINRYRGQGIGRKMIETLVKASRRAGIRSLAVEFLATNKSARRAYEKEGFGMVGIIPRTVFRSGKYFDGLVMARKL